MSVRWGFLGAGWIATRALAPAVAAADGAVLQAVAARDIARAAGLGPAGHSYDDYAELLDDDDVDAVYISLTNDMHAPWSIAALKAGKHVLCEKPLALNSEEATAMAEAAANAGRLLVEASWYRWHPRVRLAQQLIAAARIGTVRHVAADFTFAGDLDGNFRLEPSRGGGAMYDVGCYAVSAAQWAFSGAAVVHVTARQRLGTTGVDVVTEAVLTFPDGEAEIRASIAEPPTQRLVITGDSGEIEFRDAPYTSWRDDPTLLLVSDGKTTERLELPATDAYQVMVEETSAVIEGRPGWVLPVSESIETARVLDAIRDSAAQGRSQSPH
jgi:predicted dehydrogenase